MSYAAENHSTKLLHSFYDSVVRYKLKSNLVGFYFQCFPIALGVSKYVWNVWRISEALYKKMLNIPDTLYSNLESG